MDKKSCDLFVEKSRRILSIIRRAVDKIFRDEMNNFFVQTEGEKISRRIIYIVEEGEERKHTNKVIILLKCFSIERLAGRT